MRGKEVPTDVKNYIVNSYIGTRVRDGVRKRCFRWQKNGKRWEGDIYLFADHLAEKHEISTSTIHKILRDEGEAAYKPHEHHASPKPATERAPAMDEEEPQGATISSALRLFAEAFTELAKALD